MKFMVDRCTGRRLAEWLRQEGHDVVESRERGPDPGDATILQWACAEGRILITNDQDFGALIFADRAAHAGMVRLPDVPAEQRIALMSEVLARHGADLAAAAVITIRGGRIRVSRPAP